ncbi:hypothetical protein D9V60_02955 [Buchnera aphidicola (Aphis craccivora)]|uniref:Uncharacterized protein n=1 Tax=Buchnera aphidicola (Aphis craccivora) TaxID=466616 RepID=A0A4D6XPC5_9GAMM|nr:hypothetical protein [Buchnera aphidicola]QCI16798.1 hypothetical protein D9V60_02955 [Buchnera aphidicola (Aphis craccivora)]QLL40930.1 hypothetical protein F3C69_02970 [Buchnera aphidicola (Aphis craccivore)]WAI17771.1 MAG: hypothetical protein OWM53_02970 [Buchnera aphidicola (Aphis craccivora)]
MIKNAAIDLFNGTTFKKIFDAGYEFIVGSSKDESTRKVDEKIDSLVEYVKKLKKTIESSKLFIHALIEKIRDQGRLRVINKLNHNPKHPEYESSFPDLNVEIPKEENFKIRYPSDLDENFDIEVQEQNLIENQVFKEKINTNIEKNHFNHLKNNKNTWTVFDESPSLSKAKSKVTYKDMYEKLEIPEHFDKYFMIDFDSAVFLIDGHLISSTTKEGMMEGFKKLITNDIEQKFISQYANPALLKQAYLKLMAEHPELNKSRIVRAKNYYEITHLEDGTIRIIATNLSEFYSIDANDVTHHHSYGVKSSVIFSYTKAPIIKHSYVIN